MVKRGIDVVVSADDPYARPRIRARYHNVATGHATRGYIAPREPFNEEIDPPPSDSDDDMDAEVIPPLEDGPDPELDVRGPAARVITRAFRRHAVNRRVDRALTRMHELHRAVHEARRERAAVQLQRLVRGRQSRARHGRPALRSNSALKIQKFIRGKQSRDSLLDTHSKFLIKKSKYPPIYYGDMNLLDDEEIVMSTKQRLLAVIGGHERFRKEHPEVYKILITKKKVKGVGGISNTKASLFPPLNKKRRPATTEQLNYMSARHCAAWFVFTYLYLRPKKKKQFTGAKAGRVFSCICFFWAYNLVELGPRIRMNDDVMHLVLTSPSLLNDRVWLSAQVLINRAWEWATSGTDATVTGITS